MIEINKINYKSFADLSNDITHALHKIPTDIDLIVGVPRSGLMASSIMGLALNIRFCSVNAFLSNEVLATGSTRKVSGGDFSKPMDAKHILILDDSVSSGNSIYEIRKKINATTYSGKSTYMAMYATPESENLVDIYAEILHQTRFFQWNIFHRQELLQCCFDIDGVLCKDPLEEENDDAENYTKFILGASRLISPTYKIGHLVTSRLEKYRVQTEEWLNSHNISYGQLHMLEVTSAEERRRLGLHGSFKAKVYSSLKETILFVESESDQAQEISRLSGKPVLDFGNQIMINPGVSIKSSLRYLSQAQKHHPYLNLPYRVVRKLKKLLSV